MTGANYVLIIVASQSHASVACGLLYKTAKQGTGVMDAVVLLQSRIGNRKDTWYS